MSADEQRHSLAEEAAAWVPPWERTSAARAPEAEPDPAPDLGEESAPVAAVDTPADPAPEAGVDAEPEFEPEPEPELEAEPESEAEAEPGLGATPEFEAEPTAEDGHDTAPERAAVPEPLPEPDLNSERDPNPERDLDPELDLDSGPEPDLSAEPEIGAVPEPLAADPEPPAVELLAGAPEPQAGAPEPLAGAPEPQAAAPEPLAGAPEPGEVDLEPVALDPEPLPEPDPDEPDPIPEPLPKPQPPMESIVDPAQVRGALEAILLVVDEPVSEVVLAQVLERPAAEVVETLAELAEEYTGTGRGFELRKVAGGWRLYTRGDFAPYVEKFVLDGQQVRLTQAALETLAVVAYKQPVTRSRISAIRGVNCDGVIRTLVSRGLVEECGTEPDSGAYLYRTTNLFLEKLGLDSVEQLPPLAPFLPDDVDEISDAATR